MVASASKTRVSFAEYLAVERGSERKHEYIDGVVHAMSGGSPEHARLAMAIGATLTAQLSGKRCAVYSSDLRVRVQATGLATYPDVTVVCGTLEVDPADAHTATNPTVIIEVSSPSTESYDRETKYVHYRRIESLRAYVLVGRAAGRGLHAQYGRDLDAARRSRGGGPPRGDRVRARARHDLPRPARRRLSASASSSRAVA